MKKLFSPDLMFNDFVKSCWHNNNLVTTDDNKLPISANLKAIGIYAIEIEPKQKTDLTYWAVGFPMNKAWKEEELKTEKTVFFDAVTSSPITLTLQFQSKGQKNYHQKIQIDNTDDWVTRSFEIPEEYRSNLRLVLFSGPMNDMVVLLKNIVIK